MPIVINKADGDNLRKAEIAKNQYANALHLFPPANSGWIPMVETCSALSNQRIDLVWKIVTEYLKLTSENGYFKKKRQEQEIKIMMETIKESLRENFNNNSSVIQKLPELKQAVLSGRISSYKAASEVLNTYYTNLKK